ncbi:MAG: Uncharacterised protein [Marinobacterium sp. xm-d-530]|jgi:hypothetical protein|nr:MAG: Uncharacterised protein [Marinobacterium sp. xm-d-530]
MNREKVVFGFFIILALTLNVGFVLGEIDNPAHHEVFELFLALVVSLICTVLKFGDRSHLGALLLATSLVADLQLIAAALVWAYAEQISTLGMTEGTMASIVSLAAGALVANVVSVVLLVVESASIRR